MAHAIAIVDAEEDAQLAATRAVRRRVFIEEQGVPETLELDQHDAHASHVLATIGDEPVGAARHRTTRDGEKLERVAVIPERRGAGIGAALVEHIHRRLPRSATTYVHAQRSAYGFWESMGYAPEGAAFHEAGIEHRRMVRRPPR
jgi:predicted GNAT family N-acyltransferase